MDNEIYVYIHRTLTTGDVFYVGQGTKNRAFQAKEDRIWREVVAKYGLVVEIVAHGLQPWYAAELEKDLIAYYGRHDLGYGYLTNQTNGGEGRHTLSTKQKIDTSQRLKSFWKQIPKELRRHSNEQKEMTKVSKKRRYLYKKNIELNTLIHKI